MRFSANLGFLFTDRPLIRAVEAAAEAGFTAVEVHFPFDVDPDALRTALDRSGLPLLSLNTWPGDREAGDFGLAALPGRQAEAQAAIAQAVRYGEKVGAKAVHVMAGCSDGAAGAEQVFRENLAYAADLADRAGMTVLIEAINNRDVPGYHVSHVEQAAQTIAAVGAANLQLMFDCYHTQIMQGDLLRRFAAHQSIIGHVQFAGAPDRSEPDGGEVAFDRLLPAIAALGYDGWFGAEYTPRSGITETGLGWLARMQNAGQSRQKQAL